MSVLNAIVAAPPEPGHRISFVRLGHEESLDLRELHERAGRVAHALLRLGVRPGDRIGVLAANGPEWVLLDLAALRIKAVTAGFDPGKFARPTDLVTRYGLRLLFTDGEPDGPLVRSTDEVRAASNATADSTPAGPLPPVSYAPEDVTTLKFTSGSTGEPKGLGATAGSIESSLRAVQGMFGHGPGDHLFVFLPLSLLQQRYWIYSALRFGHDVTVTGYEAAFHALPRARPTVVMGVPGFYQAARTHAERRAARSGGPHEAARAMFGDRVRYLWTGSAPADPATLRFFEAAGLPIYEGYGLNETCIVTKNHPGAHRPGSVGRVVPGKRVELDSDGVIVVHSDVPVNTGYEFCAPGDSARMFGPGGAVNTGDLGRFDEDGFLYVLGRADDTIVLPNGKKIIVRPLEERLREHPEVEHCVVLCPEETRLVAVVSPAVPSADRAALAAHLAAVNRASGPDEQISELVVAEPFTIDNGLLTAQFKPRRARILDAYRDRITESRETIHAHRRND